MPPHNKGRWGVGPSVVTCPSQSWKGKQGRGSEWDLGSQAAPARNPVARSFCSSPVCSRAALLWKQCLITSGNLRGQTMSVIFQMLSLVLRLGCQLQPSAAQQPSLSCRPALQGCLNVCVALFLMSSKDKGDHREAVREFRNTGSILQRECKMAMRYIALAAINQNHPRPQ